MSLRYETSGSLNESMTQSHISFQFFTEHLINKLRIRFSYTKSLLTDKEQIETCLIQSLEKDFVPEVKDKYIEEYKSGEMKLDSIRNLITLSVEDTNGFRGASHRGGNADLHIGAHNASPGYVAGVFAPGKIIVTISLHCLIVRCDYNLEIYEEV